MERLSYGLDNPDSIIPWISLSHWGMFKHRETIVWWDPVGPPENKSVTFSYTLAQSGDAGQAERQS